MFETLNLTYALLLGAGGLGLAVLLALKLYSYEHPSGAVTEEAPRTLEVQEVA